MRKLKKICFVVLAFMFVTSSVGAASKCGVTEVANLNSEVVNISTKYEEADGKMNFVGEELPNDTDLDPEDYVEYSYLKVSIMNLSENFYLEVSNDYNNETKIYHYSDSQNGTITFDWKYGEAVTKFTIKVYSSNKTGCEGEVYRTLTIEVPRINENYQYGNCVFAKDYYLCQKFVTFEPMDFVTFTQKVDEYVQKQEEEEIKKQEEQEEKSKSWFEKTKDFVGKNKVWFITGGIMIVAAVGGTAIVIVRKRRRNEI